MAKEMLINMVAGRECRIAIVRDGTLDELYIERTSSASHVGNVYKGRVVNVEPSIQAAFIDFGLSKHGFLHISDLHPQYFPEGAKIAVEDVGRKRPHYNRPPIQECLKRGQELVVQMTKEGIGSKGPTMTTYVSIPGRMLVMMPGMARMGVSRKIEDEDARQQARQALSQLKLPSDMGFIVRTAGVGRTKRDLQRDLNYLLRLWNSVKKHMKAAKTPAELYKESDLLIRTIRDVHNKDIGRIVCDDEQTARRVVEFLRVVAPRTSHHVELYVGKEGLFQNYGLEDEIEKIYSPRVELPSGGSLVIEQTEALVAIDVNSGRFRQHSNSETTALKMNQEAAREVARQLRLRDLGGLVVIDFIDMRDRKNRRTVEAELRLAVKADRAKSKILRTSSFGIVEMTRQRVGPSLKDSIYRTCEYCRGAGLVKSDESQALCAMRYLHRAAANEDVVRIELSVTPSVAHHLANHHRGQLCDLETSTGKSIVVTADGGLAGDEILVNCTDARGSKVAWDSTLPAGRSGGGIETIALDKIPVQPSAEAERTAQPSAAQPQDAPKARRRGKRGGRKHRKKPPAGDANAGEANAGDAAAGKADETKTDRPKAPDSPAGSPTGPSAGQDNRQPAKAGTAKPAVTAGATGRRATGEEGNARPGQETTTGRGGDARAGRVRSHV